MDFEVTPDVLIPRPETEHLIEVSSSPHRRIPPQQSTSNCGHRYRVRLHRGCSGEGVSKRKYFRLGYFFKSVSRCKAQRHRQRFRRSHRIPRMRSARIQCADQPPLNMIVSNPPYVARKDAPSLPIDVREHEPAIALFAGEDGMEIYPCIDCAGEKHLAEGGLLVARTRPRAFLKMSANCSKRTADGRESAPRKISPESSE